MFDVGFWELIIIAVVALLVVGPERLPGLLRELARWTRTVRRFITETRYELERELDFPPEKDLKGKIADLEKLMHEAPDRDQQSDRDNA
jgi:sec-independent protein translocase protein TatB